MEQMGRSLVLASALLAAGHATAQDGGDAAAQADGLAEVTVTASRRESNLQTTPVSVTAIGAADLEAATASRIEQLGEFVPNLYLTDGVANQSTLTVNLRGHGEAAGGVATSESPVAFYVDEVYQSRLSVANAEFVDVERIEVLRGPQGTLFGRNSMAGAVNLVTREPSATPEARVVASVGNFDEYKLKAAVSGPLGETLSGGLSGVYTDRGRGYKRNVVTGRRVDEATLAGVRGSLRADLGAWSVRATGFWSDADNDGFVPTGIDPATLQPLYGSYLTVSLPAPSLGTTTQRGGSLRATGPLGATTLKVISAYSEVEDAFRFDISGGLRLADGRIVPGYDRAAGYDQRQWTHEVQLQGGEDGPLRWIGGAFWFEEDVGQNVQDTIWIAALGRPTAGARTTYTGGTQSYAVYGQLDWAFTERATLTAGARYTAEDKEIEGTVGATPFANRTDYSSFDPKLGLSYAASDTSFWYASVSTGFRAGGFNGFGGNVLAIATPFGEETVRAYEVGVKTTLAERRVRVNVAAFVNDYEGLQSAVLQSGGAVVTQNALDVRDTGVEVELTALATERLELTLAGGWQDQDFRRIRPGTTFAASGAKRTSNVARYSGTVGARHARPLRGGGLELRSGANLVLRDSSFASNDNNAISENSRLARVNAYLGVASADDTWSLTLVGRNLADDEDWVNGLNLVGFLGTGIRQALEPRTWALEFGYRYGR